MGSDRLVGLYDSDGAAAAVERILSGGHVVVEDYVDRVLEFGAESVWSNVAEEALVALDVIAQSVSGIAATDGQLRDFELMPNGVVSDDLVDRARRAVRAIERPGSGLRDLWENEGRGEEWLTCIDDLRRRLDGQVVTRSGNRSDLPAFSQRLRRWTKDEVAQASEPVKPALTASEQDQMWEQMQLVPGVVLAVPLPFLDPTSGIQGTSGLVLVRSLSKLRLVEVYVLDTLFDPRDPPEDLMSLVQPDAVLEGFEVSLRPQLCFRVGQVTDFDIDAWPLLFDDHSIEPTSNPFGVASRQLDPAKRRPIFTEVDLPEQATLAGLGADYLGQSWVPFSQTSAGPNVAAHQAFLRHLGHALRFEGNGIAQ